MARYKVKESKNVSFSLDKEVIEMLDKYAQESMIAKTRIVEQAIKEYIQTHSTETQSK